MNYLWALPNTVVGLPLLIVGLITGGSGRVVDGVLEVWGGALSFLLGRCVPIAGGALAMTLGHIVVGRSEHAIVLTRAHERIHVRQCEQWGPFFIPAYFLASLVAILRGGHGYRDNRFERHACAGGDETIRRSDDRTMSVDRLAAALTDRYRIERELGQGGMATVYLAEDLRHDRKVAIKVLKPDLAAVLGADRFVQEITTTAQSAGNAASLQSRRH